MNRSTIATILAALRYYRQNGQGEPCNRSDEIHGIATDGGDVPSSLDPGEIDELCERLNVAGDIFLMTGDPEDPYSHLKLVQHVLMHANQISVDPGLNKFIETAICVVGDALDRKKRTDRYIEEGS